MTTVALLQVDPRPGAVEANLAAGFAALGEAAAAGAAVAVLPEMWPRSFVDALAQPDGGIDWADALGRWRAEHARLGMAGIGGFPRQGADGRWRNSCYAIDRDGTVVDVYDKIHLFSFMDEDKRYAAGDRVVTVDLAGVRFGLAVCYDLRFPELFRALRAAGADAFVVGAQWPSARAEHWDVLCRARAIENLTTMLAVNRTGTVDEGGRSLHFGGGSLAVGPWGERLWTGGDGAEIGLVRLDLAAQRERRASFGAWQDRRLGLGPPESQ
jgi:predicted amidohydrolase